MQLLEVLRATGSSRQDLCLSRLSGRQIRWAIESGLGPTLARAVAQHSTTAASPHWPSLQSADLTARVLSAHQIEAVGHLLDVLRGRDISAVLLKGIALCHRYPSPHLRPMRDIDVMVAEPSVPAVVALSRELGYVDDPAAAPGAYDGHHHAVPLVHRTSGMWLEVHHRLFPADVANRGRDPFAPDRVSADVQASVFHGRTVGRLSPALELCYLASHWARSTKPLIAAGGVIGMLDLMLMARRASAAELQRAMALVEGSAAQAHLALALGYLESRHLLALPAGLIDDRRGAVTGWRRILLHAVIDHHVIGGVRPGGQLAMRAVKSLWRRLVPLHV